MLYHRRPQTIEAVQYTGDNAAEVQSFCGPSVSVTLKADGRGMKWLECKEADGHFNLRVGDFVYKGKPDGVYSCPEKDFLCMWEKHFDASCMEYEG